MLIVIRPIDEKGGISEFGGLAAQLHRDTTDDRRAIFHRLRVEEHLHIPRSLDHNKIVQGQALIVEGIDPVGKLWLHGVSIYRETRIEQVSLSSLRSEASVQLAYVALGRIAQQA